MVSTCSPESLRYNCRPAGVEVFMCLFSANLILSLPPSIRKGRDVYMYIGGLILTLVTIIVLTDAIFLEFMWIDHRNGSGGPLGYLQANSSIWWQNQVSNFIGDGLLVRLIFLAHHLAYCMNI